MHSIGDNFNFNNAVDFWELSKVKIQNLAQKLTQYHQKQLKSELQGLRKSLDYVNKCIFDGDNLETDQLLLESQIAQCQDIKFFFGEEKTDWLCIEGKPFKNSCMSRI